MTKNQKAVLLSPLPGGRTDCFFVVNQELTPVFGALTVVGAIHESIVCRIQISDRDFTTAPPPQTSFSFSEKEKEGKRKTAQGVPPRSEVHYFAAGRSGETMNSRRLHPPSPPKERVRPAAAATGVWCTAENVAVFRLNPSVSDPCGTIPSLASPRGEAVSVS